MPTGGSLSARVAFAAALLIGAGCISDRPSTGPSQSSGPTVTIDNFAFAPADLSVGTGTTVTWKNQDQIDHTVTSDDGATFNSGAFAPGKTFQVVAGAPGTYTYACEIHPFMKAKLIVTP